MHVTPFYLILWKIYTTFRTLYDNPMLSFSSLKSFHLSSSKTWQDGSFLYYCSPLPSTWLARQGLPPAPETSSMPHARPLTILSYVLSACQVMLVAFNEITALSVSLDRAISAS